MNLRTKAILGCLIVLVGLLAAACPKRVSIADIEANPSKYANKEVAIAGTTQTSFGISIPIISNGSGGVYKIDDGTGSIWVFTKRGVPSKGAQLGVKGKIQNGFTFGGRNYGLVLVEDDRRFKDGK